MRLFFASIGCLVALASLPAQAEDCRALPPPGAGGAPRIERALAADGLRVPLPQALSADVACVWSADAADPAGVRTVAVTACPDGVTHCALVALDGADVARQLDLRIGDAPVVRVTVPPRRADIEGWLLYLLAMIGFVVSLVMSTWVAQRARIWRIRRAWEGIDRRLRLSQEDQPEIRVRIRAILRFVRKRVFRRLPSLHDLDLLEERLREADQLSLLSERKTLLWTRAAARRLPPSVSQQFNAELRLFDRELLQLPLPFEPHALEGKIPGSLGRAEALLEAARPAWRDDNLGLLADLGRATSVEAHLDTKQPEGTLARLLADQLERETNRLRELSEVSDLSPLAEREVDLRLDVWRCLRRALHEMQDEARLDEDERYLTGPGVTELTELVRESLLDWRRTDLTRLGPDDARRALWWRLHWARDNRAIRHWLTDTEVPPAVGLKARQRWRTYTPEVVTLDIRDKTSFGQAYYWRSRVEVAWRCTTAADRVVIGGRRYDAKVDGPPPGSGSDWMLSRGPSNVAFAMHPGALRLVGWLRVPAEGGQPAGPWQPCAPITIDVDEGIDDSRARQYFFSSYARLVLSMTANVSLASVIVGHAQAEPVALLAAIKAFMLPLAVDHAALATLQLPMGLRRVINAIWKALPGSKKVG